MIIYFQFMRYYIPHNINFWNKDVNIKNNFDWKFIFTKYCWMLDWNCKNLENCKDEAFTEQGWSGKKVQYIYVFNYYSLL